MRIQNVVAVEVRRSCSETVKLFGRRSGIFLNGAQVPDPGKEEE